MLKDFYYIETGMIRTEMMKVIIKSRILVKINKTFPNANRNNIWNQFISMQTLKITNIR